jgi:thioesterase domain-containing protein
MQEDVTDHATALQQYLHGRIPISAAMGVRVLTASPDQVVLSAPIEPNVNHRETVFGGSAAAVATLAAWSVLHLALQAQGRQVRLVIQRSEMDFERPISGGFTATASRPPAADWSRFEQSLSRRNKARISVRSELWLDQQRVGSFEGDFVAIA